MQNGWRWWCKMREMVCEVCVEALNLGSLPKILKYWVFILLGKLLERFWFFYRISHNTSRALQHDNKVAVLGELMLPHGLSLQGRITQHGSCTATRLVCCNTGTWWSYWMNWCRHTAASYRAVFRTRPVLVHAPIFHILFWLVLLRFNSELRSAFFYIFLIIGLSSFTHISIKIQNTTK